MVNAMICTCKNCGVEFRAKSANKQFCSQGCKIGFHHKIRLLTCPVCGVQFIATANIQKYCSKACYVKAYRQRQKEKLNA